MIRELTTNAFDAHKEAGVKDAVAVGFNSKLTEFFVQDFGTGLSPERVDNIYSKYLASTKEQTDDEHGYWGLGSKSPLAYADAFTIETIFDGKKYIYMMSKGETNTELTLLSTEDTDQRNGTKISVVVKQDDIGKFKAAASAQLAYFDNVFFMNMGIDNDYKIFRGKHFSYSTMKHIDDGDHYKGTGYSYTSIYNRHTRDQRKLGIMLGKVWYPIREGEFPDFDYSLPIALNFKIGDLPVTPSREDIRYIGDVKDKIKHAYEAASAEISGLVKDKTDFKDPKELYNAISSEYELELSKDIKLTIPAGYVDTIKYKGKLFKYSRLEIDNMLMKVYNVRGRWRNGKFYTSRTYFQANYLIGGNHNIALIDRQGVPRLKLDYIYERKLARKGYYVELICLSQRNLKGIRFWKEFLKKYSKDDKLLVEFVVDIAEASFDYKTDDITVPDDFKPTTKTVVTPLKEDEIIFYRARMSSTSFTKDIVYDRTPLKLSEFPMGWKRPIILGTLNKDEDVLKDLIPGLDKDNLTIAVTARKNLKNVYAREKLGIYTYDEFMDLSRPFKRGMMYYRVYHALEHYDNRVVALFDSKLAKNMVYLWKQYSDSQYFDEEIYHGMVATNNNSDELYDPKNIALLKEVEEKLEQLEVLKVFNSARLLRAGHMQYIGTINHAEKHKLAIAKLLRANKYRMDSELYNQLNNHDKLQISK